jgi:hypothetical protein
VAWPNCRLDFSGAAFDGGSLDGARFVHCEVLFTGCRFAGEGLSVRGAWFDRSVLDCSKITIGADCALDLAGTTFELSTTRFTGIRLATGTLGLQRTRWQAGFHDFGGLRLDGGRIDFGHALFSTSRQVADYDHAALVDFGGGELVAGVLSFNRARFEYEQEAPAGRRGNDPSGDPGRLWPMLLSLGESRLAGASVDFSEADFVRGEVSLCREAVGGAVSFRLAKFRAGRVSFVWSHLTDCLLDFGQAPPTTRARSCRSHSAG